MLIPRIENRYYKEERTTRLYSNDNHVAVLLPSTLVIDLIKEDKRESEILSSRKL